MLSDDKKFSGNKMKSLMFWLIVIICSAPVVLATLTYYFFKPSQFINYGELVQPPIQFDTVVVRELARPVVESALIDTNPTISPVTTLKELKGRWILAYIASGSQCLQECKETLYLTRQVRLMTGKNRFRVERVWISFKDDGPLLNNADKELEGLWAFKTDVDQFPFNSGSESFVGFWIVDPLGRLIMRYPKDADPKRVYKDLSRLLKASRIG